MTWPDAACRKADPAVFFPGENDRTWSAKPAIEICMGCPVRAECRAAAEANEEFFGVWGGVDFGNEERERKRLRMVSRREEAKELAERGLTAREISNELEVSRRTVHRFLRKQRAS